ncbi:MAG: DNA mismatch repair protein MutS, partial [Bacillota bacterium]|nr:DNA mismatch repair protein MutS [Bacillota bacterium]
NGFEENPAEMLQNYLEFTAKQSLNHIGAAVEYNPSDALLLDSGSIRNLELVETMNGKKKKGSLLGVVDYTCTAMGARFLRESLKSPLLDLERIRKRQDFVAFLSQNYWDRSSLRSLLEKIYDIERIVTKLVYDTATLKDLVAIKNSLFSIHEIKKMSSPDFAYLYEGLNPLEEIAGLIDEAVLETGESIKDGYSSELDEVRSILGGGKKWILELERREKEKTNIKSLKVSYNKVFGYYIEVSKSFAEKVPAHYIRRQTLVNSERFVTDELKELEDKVLSVADHVGKLEKQIFEHLKSELKNCIPELKDNAAAISEIDLLASFSEAAYIRGYVRPLVDESNVIEIEEGRHAVIETLSAYIPNRTYMNDESDKIFVLTGPNMAGKSSYLRQNALIIILAQLGSFVPAKKARIGLIDRIFTRVGASDDLAEGRSTFMVEMKELAYILDHLTPRSFVILDEIGRGTSTLDGLSIALSVVEYLSRKSAKVMFATHYHELTVLEGRVDGVLNYRIDVKKEGDDIVFLRHIVRGTEDRSYGIEVAMLAGVSGEVVTRAKEILKKLERGEAGVLGRHAEQYANLKQNILQDYDADFSAVPVECDEQDHAKNQIGLQSLVCELRELEMDDVSPKMAWEILSRLQKEVKR